MSQHYLATREGLAEALRLTHRALELDAGSVLSQLSQVSFAG
jgi:hypothetical protein